jgi:hypothetical protein
MLYTLLGRLVWYATKLVLRERYGRTMVPKPLLAGAVLVAAVGALLALQRRDSSGA